MTDSVLDRALSVARVVVSSSPSWWLVAVLGLLLIWFLRVTWRQARQVSALRSRLHGAGVRRGFAGEALAPLLESFPVDVDKEGTATLFLGQPVDYVHFDPNEGVTFIEVKSGTSGLSQRQRLVRQRIEAGQVRWVTVNIDRPRDREVIADAGTRGDSQ